MIHQETFAICSSVQEVAAIPEELLSIPPQGKVPVHTLTTLTVLRLSTFPSGEKTSVHRWMYWTDHGSPAKIERASMDGTSRMVLHSTTLRTPTAITLDYQTQTLYWLDYSLDRLESSRTDGSGRILLTTNSIRSPFDVTFYGGYLYWTDHSYYRLLSTPVRNPSDVTFLTPRRCCNALYGVQVISEDRQPSGNYLVEASCHVS